MSPNLIAVAEGIVLGALTAVIWRNASSRVRKVEFWESVIDLARSLFDGGDEREFIQHYGRVLTLLARYLGRQALILGMSFLPVTVFVTLLAPHLHEIGLPTASDREFSKLQGDGGGEALASTGDSEGHKSAAAPAAPQALAPAGGEIPVGPLVRDNGDFESAQQTPDLAVTGFAQVHTARRQTAETLSAENTTEFWSWLVLSDWEISFYAALSAASAVGLLVLSRRPA
jgi:hypothetical protein